MSPLDPDTFSDLFDLAREVCRVSHVTYGVELTVSEVVTSVFMEQGRDELATVGRLHVLLHDPPEMRKWLANMVNRECPTRREHTRRISMRFMMFVIFMFMAAALVGVVAMGGPLAWAGGFGFAVLGGAIGMAIWEVFFGRANW